MKTSMPVGGGFAGGLASSLGPAIKAFGNLNAVKQQAGAQGALMGAQTNQAAEQARGLGMTNNSRANPFALLEDPQIAEYAKSNPSFANALRVGLGLFGATGQGDVAGMLPKVQGADLTGQGVERGNAGDLANQNRLIAAASGKTYEPFKAVGDTGYSMDAGTGNISTANPALAALFGQESASKVTKNARENTASAITYDPVSGLVIDKTTGQGRPVQVQGAQSGQLFGKRAQDAKAERIAVESATSDLDRLAGATEAVLNHPGLDRITGLVGMAPNIPGGNAANAQALFDTLKSQIGFSVLAAMRAASKTGGALGAVSDKENEMLQNNLAALSTTQSPEQMRASLKNILSYVNDSKARISGAYNSMYGSQQPSPQDGQPFQSPDAAGQRQPVQRAIYNGRVIVKYSDGSVEYE